MSLLAPSISLNEELDRQMGQTLDFPQGGDRRRASPGYPALNIREDADKAHVEAELPGLSLEQVEVLVCGDQLTIGGEQPSGAAAADTIWQRRERPVGAFSRSIGLPWEIPTSPEKTWRGYASTVNVTG